MQSFYAKKEKPLRVKVPKQIISVYLPKETIAMIDRMAQKNGLKRNSYLSRVFINYFLSTEPHASKEEK